jgi:predicted ATPase
MNEQLVVKNFGPIKDATVDFKRVTVFIGPTGGGKSTLAKLAAVFKRDDFFGADKETRRKQFSLYSIENFFSPTSWFHWIDKNENYEIHSDLTQLETLLSGDKIVGRFEQENKVITRNAQLKSIIDKVDFDNIKNIVANWPKEAEPISPQLLKTFEQIAHIVDVSSNSPRPIYFPSNRALVPAVEYSWAGLLRDDIGLPKDTLDFANDFSLSRKHVLELDIPFLKVKYLHRNGQDFIKIPESETLFRLYETASGIQSVTPLLVLLEHLSRNTEQAQSFIIEEPELNLYPTAQQGLLNWLVEKCTKGENDLTITTHSPYILAGCNLLLEAHKVARQRPELAAEIAAVVPKEYWIDPDEFAAYYVADGTVKPITDVRTHLIGNNELDAISGDIADRFYKLLQLQKQKPATA